MTEDAQNLHDELFLIAYKNGIMQWRKIATLVLKIWVVKDCCLYLRYPKTLHAAYKFIIASTGLIVSITRIYS